MTSRNQPSGNLPTFLSIAAVRRELGDISRATVYRMFDSGTLSRTTVGRRVLVPRADVEALLASGDLKPNYPARQLADHSQKEVGS